MKFNVTNEEKGNITQLKCKITEGADLNLYYPLDRRRVFFLFT